MIVHYCNVVRLAVPPGEANPPLIIDPYAVLPGSISSESFETITRRNAEFSEPLRGVEVEQLATRHTLDRPEPEHGRIVE